MNTIEAIDNILPQTQCGLCGYAGCKPYAEAIVNQHEMIDRCLPGGVETLVELAKLTQQDASPYLEEMQKKLVPLQLAVIREEECIGCTKCIQACPVDAIIGAAKQMHTVLTDICTGCGLCVPPCPVDCIDMIHVATPSPVEKQHKAQQALMRFQARNLRLENREKEQQKKLSKSTTSTTSKISYADVAAAVARAAAKISMKNF